MCNHWCRLLFVFSLFFSAGAVAQQGLHATSLASRWDEGLPLGNGLLGALIWQQGDSLRFSLDNALLWDQRPMKGLHRKEFSYQWVIEQVMKKDYKPVQQYFDWPYDQEPAPTKLPGAALQFNSSLLGKVISADLDIRKAISVVRWSGGAIMTSIVHATKPVGWFVFENVPDSFKLSLHPPRYQGAVTNAGDPVGGDDLSRLGYRQGSVLERDGLITYHQDGWGGFNYNVRISYTRNGNRFIGKWTIDTNSYLAVQTRSQIDFTAADATQFDADMKSHTAWWTNYWSASSISVPDSILMHQWYMEQYKFGSTSRRGAPPISLQAVWTADNGRIAPWKGDFHHDLNTQLSYWPAYSGNHLEEALAYLDHLDQNKKNYSRYTKLFFKTEGLAVPGVTTLDGTEMGGWIQYSLSPTVSSWLAHHYYLQWKYSMDKTFLQRRAYPWLKQVCTFLEKITRLDSAGKRQLVISSSPEFFDNDLKAWFHSTTNYDLSLMTFSFEAAAEMADSLRLKSESSYWRSLRKQLPSLTIDRADRLMIAPGFEYDQSHRHFSHLMAIHPLGLLNWNDGEASRRVMRASLSLLDSVGPANWCGYSYSWLANMKARAHDGNGAAAALRIFAEAFCSPNSFHLNGDQSGKGYSTFTYRPFTLEGNFAFASGLQEMLIQSHEGFIELFPSIPARWSTASFHQLRTQGAFLVDAEMKDGNISSVKLASEKGVTVKLKLPFSLSESTQSGSLRARQLAGDFVEISGPAGGSLTITRGE